VAFIAFFSGTFPLPALFQGFVQSILPWNPVARLAQNLTGLLQGNEANNGHMVIFSSVFIGIMIIILFIRTINWGEITARRDDIKKEK
jgi:hypothetical protein